MIRGYSLTRRVISRRGLIELDAVGGLASKIGCVTMVIESQGVSVVRSSVGRGARALAGTGQGGKLIEVR